MYKLGPSSRMYKLEFINNFMGHFPEFLTFCNHSHNFWFSEIPFFSPPEIPLASNYSLPQLCLGQDQVAGEQRLRNKQTKCDDVLPCPCNCSFITQRSSTPSGLGTYRLTVMLLLLLSKLPP